MPYASNLDLPASVRNHLPDHAQDIYRKAFNNAYAEYQDPAKRRGGGEESLDQVAAKVAWSAVKKEYEKVGNAWVKKSC